MENQPCLEKGRAIFMKGKIDMKKISRILCLLMTFLMVFSLISLSPVGAQEASEPETQINEDTQPEEFKPVLAEPIEWPETTETPAEDPAAFSTRATYTNGYYRPRAVVWTYNGEKIS